MPESNFKFQIDPLEHRTWTMLLTLFHEYWGTTKISFSCINDFFLYCFIISLSERAGEEGKALLLGEIEFMQRVGCHRNVLSMLGYWVKSEPIMLILEYASHGDLLKWLRDKRQLQVQLFCCFKTRK